MALCFIQRLCFISVVFTVPQNYGIPGYHKCRQGNVEEKEIIEESNNMIINDEVEKNVFTTLHRKRVQ
jgi:hypothetical protein